MKDFKLRDDTKLLFRNDPSADLAEIVRDKNVMFVYGGGSVMRNGCHKDISDAAGTYARKLVEFGGASREFASIEKGIRMVKDEDIDLIIGAGGAQVMDCSKLIALGTYNEKDLWDFLEGRKDPYGLRKVPLVLVPTYPSSGSEYGLGAVAVDSPTGKFGTAYGIPADIALLVPKYSLTLGREMTAYTGLVALVQLCASVLGDRNPVSYSAGISVIRNVSDALEKLREDPDDLDARGTVLFGASISTSGLLGLGKTDGFAYEIYELEFAPEVLFGVPYRRSLTVLFPRFLKAMARYHDKEISSFLKDAFGLEGDIGDRTDELVGRFSETGVDMYFDGTFTEEQVSGIPMRTTLNGEEVCTVLKDCMRKN